VCETVTRSDLTVAEFRPDGSLQRRLYKNPPPDSSEWTDLYEYNGANQLSAVRVEQGGTITIRQVLQYDAAGRISQVVVPDKEGGQRIAETYSYETGGTKTKIMYIDPSLPSEDCGTIIGVDGTDACYAAPGAASVTSIYEDGGRPVDHLFNDSSGNLVTSVHFRYDEHANLVEEVCSRQKLPPEVIDHLSAEQQEAVRLLFTSRRYHSYDTQGRKIETSVNMGPLDFDRQTFTYNDHGDVVSQISESSHSEYSLEDAGGLAPKPDSTRSNRSEAQFRYQYDLQGNWLEKIVENPGGPIWSTERRTITYF
jgi:hypothetical protein